MGGPLPLLPRNPSETACQCDVSALNAPPNAGAACDAGHKPAAPVTAVPHSGAPFDTGTSPADGASGAADDDGSAAGDFIVRFDSYGAAAQHRAALAASLGPETAGRWRWLERRNAAASLPTDFALIRVADGALAAVKATALATPGVRGVHADRRYTGRLHWRPEGKLRSLFADGDMPAAARTANGGDAADASSAGASSQQGSAIDDEDVFAVRRKPGRATTPSSFDVHDAVSGYFNVSGGGAGGRELLGRGLTAPVSVAHLLKAHELWQAGYTGKGVKVRRYARR